MNCPKCGFNNSDGNAFCTECGFKMTLDKQPCKANKLKTIFNGVLLLIVGFYLGFNLHKMIMCNDICSQLYGYQTKEHLACRTDLKNFEEKIYLIKRIND